MKINSRILAQKVLESLSFYDARYYEKLSHYELARVFNILSLENEELRIIDKKLSQKRTKRRNNFICDDDILALSKNKTKAFRIFKEIQEEAQTIFLKNVKKNFSNLISKHIACLKVYNFEFSKDEELFDMHQIALELVMQEFLKHDENDIFNVNNF